MKIATTIGELNGYVQTPAEAVAAYAGTGFRYLDYSFYNVLYPGSPYLNGEDWKKEIYAAADAAAANGMTFVQAHSPNYNPLDLNGDHEAGVRATLNSIEACEMLGIPNIVVHSGYTGRILYQDGREQYYRENDVFFRALYPVMERTGVRVCIENSAEGNMGACYFFMTAADMNDYIAHCGHPLMGACWDIGHANMRHADQYKELTELGSNLHAVHIQDNHGGSDEHIAPFFGTVNLDDVMRALVEIRFAGPFTFESDYFLPYRRTEDGPLGTIPLAVKRSALALLHQIGRSALDAYGIAED